MQLEGRQTRAGQKAGSGRARKKDKENLSAGQGLAEL